MEAYKRISWGVFALLLVLLSACSSKTTDEQYREDAGIISQSQEEIDYITANSAYNNKEYLLAEELYTKSLQGGMLPTPYRIEALLRLATLAKERTDYAGVLRYTMGALQYNGSIIQELRWYKLWKEAIVVLRNEDAIRSIKSVMTKVPAGTSLNGSLSMLLSYALWSNGHIVEALQTAQQAWNSTAGAEGKIALEKELYIYAQETASSTFTLLSKTVTSQNMGTFPYSIFSVEMARRLSVAGKKGDAYNILQQLEEMGTLYNKQFVEQDSSKQAHIERKVINIVLLLPLSSRFKEYSWQIVNGATIAQERLARLYGAIKVHFVNTDTKNWLQQLKAFPEGTLIGGPLQSSVFAIVSKAGLLSKFTFFTFLSSLPAGVEGLHAWRFYPKPADQITSLLNFTLALGIKNFGMLYPVDSYGKTMASLFSKSVGTYGASVRKAVPYSGRTASWTAIVGQYLSTEMVKGQPVPNANFTATFLPDSFLNATILVPSFFYNGEQRQVFMGTSLWEERGGRVSYIDSNFVLAIYPSMWNPTSRSAQSVELKKTLQSRSLPVANRWSGLGYDFVRFGYLLQKSGANSAKAVNAFLVKRGGFDWTMAPITWSAKGVATQQLYILSPHGKSGKSVTPSEFYEKMKYAYDVHNKRIDAIVTEEKG